MADMAVGYIDEDNCVNESVQMASIEEDSVHATHRKHAGGLFKAHAAIAPSAATGMIGGALVRIIRQVDIGTDRMGVGVERKVACHST